MIRSTLPWSIHESISSRVSWGRASPNHTTPGRRRPVSQDGQWGRSAGLIVGVSLFGSVYVAWAAAVLADGARRVSDGAVIESNGWKGSSKLFCSTCSVMC